MVAGNAIETGIAVSLLILLLFVLPLTQVSVEQSQQW